MGVSEVWKSRQQYEKWFDENVKPNVPFEIKQEVIEPSRRHTAIAHTL